MGARLLIMPLFKKVGAAAISWDPANKDASVTLSNSNRTMTGTANVNFGAHATRTTSVTKVYFEASWDTAAFNAIIGFGTGATANSGTPGLADTTAFSISANGGGLAYNGSSNGGTWAGIAASGVMGLAFDSSALLVWATADGTTWNTGLGGTQNPATGQGGFSVAALSAGPYYPLGMVGANTDVLTGNFTSGQFAYTPPTGFSAP